MKIVINTRHGEFTIEDNQIVQPQDWIPAQEYNPHNVRPWLIHHAFGAICIVFAEHEQDALDIAADNGKLDTCLIAESDYAEYEINTENEACVRLGNASEPFDLVDIGIVELPNPETNFLVMLRHAYSQDAA